jgi:hypothetical protein
LEWHLSDSFIVWGSLVESLQPCVLGFSSFLPLRPGSQTRRPGSQLEAIRATARVNWQTQKKLPGLGIMTHRDSGIMVKLGREAEE